MVEELYRIQNISYKKDSTLLLNDINLYQYKGETIGLMGLHDSGKTILARIMSGELKPCEGNFYYEEMPVSCKDFTSHVFMIQEHTSLIGSLSVMENIFIIRRHHRTLFVHKKAILAETVRLMAEMNLLINPQEKVGNLSRLEQCLVEMLKAYTLGARLIILDNIPLTDFQDVRFSRLLEQLKFRNVYFFITSSDIYQLQLFSDRIYFLSDGSIIKWIYNEKRKKEDISKLYNRPITYLETPSLTSSEISVCADNICYHSLENISFQLFEGEIVTMFDLFRNVSGQLLTLLSNPQKLESGSLSIYGEAYGSPGNNQPFVFANFDLKNSVFETLSIRDNICMSNYKKLAYPVGVLKNSRIKYFEDLYLEEYKKDGITAKKHCYHPSKKERLAIYLSRFELLKKKVIFCINPEKYIDYDTIYLLKNALQRIANKGNTICIITCDFEKVYPLASRHLILLSDSVQEYEKVSPVS